MTVNFAAQDEFNVGLAEGLRGLGTLIGAQQDRIAGLEKALNVPAPRRSAARNLVSWSSA